MSTKENMNFYKVLGSDDEKQYSLSANPSEISIVAKDHIEAIIKAKRLLKKKFYRIVFVAEKAPENENTEIKRNNDLYEAEIVRRREYDKALLDRFDQNNQALVQMARAIEQLKGAK